MFVRAFFDTGAEADLMSAKCAIGANLKQTKYCVEMEGITGREIIDTGLVQARIFLGSVRMRAMYYVRHLL